MPFGRKQDRKIAGDHPNRRRPSFSLYCLILSLLAFLFSLLGAVWHSKRSSLHIAPPPHVRVTLKYISMYFLIVCRLVFLFSLLCAVWQKTRSQNRRRPSKFIFFVFPHCVPASLFIFFTLCRLAEYKIAKSQETIKFIFFVLSYFVPASLFIFITWCRLAFRTSLSTLHLRPTCE